MTLISLSKIKWFTLVTGFIGGIVGSIVSIFLLSSIFPGYLSGIIGNTLSEPQSTPTPTVIPNDNTQRIVQEASLSSVAIQTFEGSKLTRQGSGVVISSDGLILTTADVISGGSVIQILSEGKINKARLLNVNWGLNLAIIKLDDTLAMKIAVLDNSLSFSSGQELIITGKASLLSKPEIFTQKAIVNYLIAKETLLDTTVNSFISGAKILSGDGKYIGLTYIRSGKVYAIDAQTINDFINKYLSK